jgi:FkbM family methyltransferase
MDTDLQVIETLDYEKAPIKLHVTSEVERRLRVNSCQKEKETVAWIESLPTGVLFDIGANVGAYSFVAAVNGHMVLAFEPPGPTFDRLEQNITLNNTVHVMAYPVLLGDENAMVPFSYSSLDPGAALHSLGAGGEHVSKIQMQRLDDYAWDNNLPYPDYMKLDVDGMELRVLVGAEKCLGHARSIQVEIDDGLASSQRVQPFLEHHGFTVTDWTRHGNGHISNVRFDR